MAVIGVDLGGTRLRVGLVFGTKILARYEVLTEAQLGFDHVFNNMLGLTQQALEYAQEQGWGVSGLGIGSPGPLDSRSGVILSPPNLPGWDNVPLASLLAAHTRLPVALDNDANAAALGEWLHGAGQGCNNLVYVTISTGIGGGVIAEGRLLRGESGGAAELGHINIQAIGGAPCACGKTGCLEAYASGTGIVRRTLELLAQGAEPSVLHRAGELNPKSIAQAASQGDKVSIRVLSEASHYLGVGLANILTLFNPKMLILGGGLTALQEQLILPAIDVMKQHVFGTLAANLLIAAPALGADAGLIGAAALVDYPGKAQPL